jgi:2-desacetyl-2-hydroxyethyl bacteriochlorophyllide A dehydrogenase
MRAVVVESPGGPEVLTERTWPDPVAGDLDVVVRIAGVGVCGQDQAIRSGLVAVPPPFVPGHEIAGKVVEVGAKVTRFAPGDLVAAKQFSSCGSCLECRSGRDVDCADRVHVYGGYAECAAIAEDALLEIPGGLEPAAAAIVACAIGSCLQALTSVARVQAGEYVVVTGAGGGLGTHAIQLVRAVGAVPIAVTTSPRKAARLRELGAELVLNSRDEAFVEALVEATRGGPQVVLDNVGHPEGFRSAFRALRRRGRYVFTGQLHRERVSFYPALAIHKEAVITGSASTNMGSFMRAMELVSQGAVRPVIKKFRLAEAAVVHERMAGSELFGRAVLVP